MKRIFVTLTVLSTVLLFTAFILGWISGDPKSLDETVRRGVSLHRLTSLAALIFATLVHAILLTYFMGTGRWLEETCKAYSLGDKWLTENQSLKYRSIMAMVGAMLMLIATGACGAAIDPTGAVRFEGWGAFSGATIHFYVASITLIVNLLVNAKEFQAVSRNNQIIDMVMDEVHRIRREKGLPV